MSSEQDVTWFLRASKVKVYISMVKVQIIPVIMLHNDTLYEKGENASLLLC